MTMKSGRKQTKTWTTKDGGRIRICDMGDTHLVNTINMLIRYAKAKHRATLADLECMACMIQGDIASYMIDQDIDRCTEASWQDFVPEIFWSLWKEAERRGGLFDEGHLDSV